MDGVGGGSTNGLRAESAGRQKSSYALAQSLPILLIVMVDFCGAISCGLQNFLVATREEGDSCHSNIKLHMASIGRYDVMNWCRSDKCGVLYLYVV